MSKPTIKDVAQKAGVAVSTVSLVINNRSRVSPKTRAKVERAIEELGYQPNAVAQRLARNEGGCVAVLVPSISNPFFSPIVREIQIAMQRHGYDLMIYSTEDDPKVEAFQIDAARRNRVGGIFIIGEHTESPSPNDEQILKIIAEGTQLVLIERQIAGNPCPSVIADKCSGEYKATRHLLSLGHEKVAFIGGFLNRGWSAFRKRGFERALIESQIDLGSAIVVDGDFSSAGGYRATKEILGRAPVSTGIICANDQMAIGALRALRDENKRVPQDVSIIGFDNIPESRYLLPSLTTVNVPTEEMGKRAADLMAQHLSGGTVPPSEWLLDTELILRESTALRQR